MRKKASGYFSVTTVRDGDKGNDAVVYEIVPSVGSVIIPSDQTSVSFSLSASFYKRVGQGTRSAYSCYAIAYSRTANGYTKLTALSSKNSSIPLNNVNVGTTALGIVIFISDSALNGSTYTSTPPTSFLAKIEIPVLKNGNTGSRGKIGRMFYLAGKWSSGKSFIRNDNVCPVVEHNNSYWYLDADSSQGDTPSNNSTVWKMAENFGVVLTEALFTLFAKLGSFVVAEDFFISQYGTIYSSTQEKEIDSTNYDHYFGAYGSSIIDTETSDSYVSAAYTFFDENDPMVKTKPSSGSLKFRPALCINALTGEMYMAKGNVHISSSGDVNIKGALMYHKVLVDKANNYIRPFTFWKANGAGMDIDASGTVANITLHGDTIIISGSKRDSSYSLFSGITCVGYTIILPPARFFEGMRIRIINGTISGSNGTAASLNPSQINLAVIYRENDMERYKDNVDLAYTANMIVAAVPVKFRKGTVDFTFVGSPDSAKCTDLTPSSANRFTVFGLMGSPNALYKSIELVAQKNPYVSTYNTTQNGQDASDYAWMIIEANE